MRLPSWREWPVKVLAGVVLLAAIGLLWPFAGWSWWPIVGGLTTLVLLALLRLDRLLFGWAPHLAGLVTVVLLAARSDPWAWGLAAGIAVLGVGLARLPRRAVLAVGAALVVAFGTGYGITHYRTVEQRRAEQAVAATQQAHGVVAIAPELLGHVLARSIATGDAQTTCDVLGSPAGQQFAAAHQAPDCPAAVARLAGQVRQRDAARLAPGSLVKSPGAATLDACPVSGPKLGRFTLSQYQGGDRYQVTGYAPCP